MSRIARALLAVAVLAALLGGVPVALIRWGVWPISGVPSWAQVRDMPTTIVSDEALVGLLTLALWASWAIFVASFLAEVVAQLRGRTRPATNVGGPVQRLAAYLVSSLVMGIAPVGSGLAGLAPAGAAAAESPLPVTFVPAPDAAGQQLAGAVADSSAGAHGPTVVAGRGDTAWSLAETHLGEGTRWSEIWELNRDRPQADGSVWADPAAPVQAGWELFLPGGAGVTEVVGVTPVAAVTQTAVNQPVVPPMDPAVGETMVQPGDNFWVLAEAELTNAWGRAPSDAEIVGYWQEYVEGNRDRLAPPGDPNLIFPGQAFSVPAPPADPLVVVASPDLAEPPPPATPAPEEEPDDTTSSEDDATSETGTDYPPDVEADGSDESSPLTIPAADAEDAETGDDPDCVDDSEAGASSDDSEDDAGGAPVPPSRTSESDDPADPTGTDGSGGGAGSEGEQASAADSYSDESSTSRRPIGLIGGGLALAGVLLLVERRRRAQQRHRRSGQRIPMPPPTLEGEERALREGADVDGARLLDLALRAAAAGSGATGLPPLRWVETTPGAVMLVLASAAPPPPGFFAVADDRWVTHGPLDELAVFGSSAAAPAPTLVPVSATADGTELLVELEASGVATVEGAPDEVAGFVRAIAVALATAPWSEQPRVLLVGMEGELTELPWVESRAQLSDALTEVEAHVERTVETLRSLRCQTTAQARAVGVTPESWDPLVVVSTVRPESRDDLRRLAALADRPPRAVAVVTPAPLVGAVSPGQRFTIGEDGWLRIDGVETETWPRRLDDDDAEALVALLDVAARRDDVAPGEDVVELEVRRPASPPPPPPPPPPPVPSAPSVDHGGGAVVELSQERPIDTLMTEVEVIVRVLGEVEAVRLRGRRADEDGSENGAEKGEEKLVPTRQKGLETIAYLALRESAADREDLESILFPDGANAAKTVYNTISSARRLLGETLFPPPAAGRYELSEQVVTDYGLFCELVAMADEVEDAATAAELLTDALGLVRGEPFVGVGRGYSWVGPHRGIIVAQVVDAAEELAEVRLAMGDWRAAEWAARRGLRAFPSDERMYRLLMRTSRAAGNIPGVQRVFRELCDVIADPDLGVEPEDTLHPETVELLEELTGTTQRRRQATA